MADPALMRIDLNIVRPQDSIQKVSSMVWLCVLLAVTALVAIAWLIKPEHVGTRFTRTPPVVARVNAPNADAKPEMLLLKLPTGDQYTIQPGSRGHFILVFDWKVPVRINGKGVVLTVPKLSPTDFASIPRLLHSLISPLNNTIYAAILHDYLYRDPQDSFASSLDRKTVDRMFYWGMRARGVWRPTAGLMYLGVRLGGSLSYKRSVVLRESAEA